MTESRPRVMDWLCLVLAVTLALAPGVGRAGILRAEATFLLDLFPSGFLMAGLVLAVGQSVFRAPLSFGLTGGRWATLLSILICAGLYFHTVASLIPMSFGDPARIEAPGLVVFLTTPFRGVFSAIVTLSLLYVFVMLFSGARLGPKKRSNKPT